jgi:hypothetical protein
VKAIEQLLTLVSFKSRRSGGALKNVDQAPAAPPLELAVIDALWESTGAGS